MKVGFVTEDGIAVAAEVTKDEETDFRKSHAVVGFIHNVGVTANVLESLALLPSTGEFSIKKTLEYSHAEAFRLGQRYERLATFPRLRKIKQQVENSIGRGYMGYEFCLGCEDEHNSPIVGQILLANGVSLEDFVEEVNRGAIRVTLNRGRLMIQGCHLNLGQLLDAAAECMKRQIPAA